MEPPEELVAFGRWRNRQATVIKLPGEIGRDEVRQAVGVVLGHGVKAAPSHGSWDFFPQVVRLWEDQPFLPGTGRGWRCRQAGPWPCAEAAGDMQRKEHAHSHMLRSYPDTPGGCWLQAPYELLPWAGNLQQGSWRPSQLAVHPLHSWGTHCRPGPVPGLMVQG